MFENREPVKKSPKNRKILLKKEGSKREPFKKRPKKRKCPKKTEVLKSLIARLRVRAFKYIVINNYGLWEKLFLRGNEWCK